MLIKIGMFFTVFVSMPLWAQQKIKAVYIPLADHYAGVVAYERYGNRMEHADFQLERMGNWSLLRARFLAGEADMAFVMSPLAMDMFLESPHFRWVSLIHRDGNALAINSLFRDELELAARRADRKPDRRFADALAILRKRQGKPIKCGVPDLLATHTVVLYKYLKDQGMTLGVGFGPRSDLLALTLAPPRAPAFLKKNSNRGIPATFEQSLPWADVVETGGFGHVAWYSKDVLKWPRGHVECIILATDKAIREKEEAVREVISYIHRAGRDLEIARREGGKAMDQVVEMVRRHIPEHNPEAIIQSLRVDLLVINYSNLNIDKPGLQMIMDLAVEGKILRSPIDIDRFGDDRFSTRITER